jgi:hypothetical protein
MTAQFSAETETSKIYHRSLAEMVAEIIFFTSTLSARFCQRIEGCGKKVEGKILAFLLS